VKAKMVRVDHVLAILAEGWDVTQPGGAIADEHVLAFEIRRLLTRCAYDAFNAQKIIELLKTVNDSDDFVFDERLEILNGIDEHESEPNDEEYYEEFASNSIAEPVPQTWTFHGESFPIAKVEKALKYYRDTDKDFRTLSSMKSKFVAMIKSESDLEQLRRFERKKNEVGHAVATRRAHLAEIDRQTHEWFKEMENQKVQIHSAHIAEQAREIHETLGSPFRFDASPSWVNKFNNIHNIVSRRVTKWISRPVAQNERLPRVVANEFLEYVGPIVAEYEPEEIVNCDQTPCYFECHSTRTMSAQGVKTVERIAERVDDMSHSLTIMVPTTAAGTLYDKLFVQIKQPGGQFPKYKPIFTAPNLVAVAGNSHIMTINTYKIYLEKCLIPNLPQRALLLLDQWPGFGNEEANSLIEESGKQVRIERLPAHTTPFIQPWDVYPARVWKTMKKKVDTYVVMKRVEISDCVRDRELKKHALIHNQLCAEQFRPLFRHAWCKAGYFDEHVGQFPRPVEVCFKGLGTECCKIECDGKPFMRCSHCSEVLCFQHFYEDFHGHF